VQSFDQITKKENTMFALNEVFAAEKNVGHSSVYRIKVNDEYMGRFKSSGLIIVTGTGSTGWLQSAKRTSYNDVEAVFRHLGYQEA
jgi:NAD kinase